ncbi:MAG: nuclear transport factor 2 family protein [Gemmatimonadaceae bacterium]
MATLRRTAGAVALSVACAGVGRGQIPTPRAEIAAMMERSAAAWNRGDLDAFVDDYEDGTTTSYIGRTGILHGRTAIRGAYAPRFAAGVPRDSLSFEGLEVDVLAQDVANAIAFYVLKRGGVVTARGPTSLVLRRRGGRWRIVHDHSS